MPIYFITGANRGLGLEFVRQLSADKSNTIIAGTRSLDSDLSEVKSFGENVHVVQCDTGSLPSIQSLVDSIPKLLGSNKIDYVFNNAGINSTSSDDSLHLDPASVHKHIDVNVLGPAKVVETLQPYLADRAVIMNMSSGLGSIAQASKFGRGCTYSVSKAALNMLTVLQARDLEGKAIVISMDPGWVKTRMGGAGAVMEPHDSIAGMLKVIHGLKPEDSGKFYKSEGGEVPW